MKPNVMLTIASLLAILFMTLHLTDDILRNQDGSAQGLSNALVVILLVVWLYAILLFAERRWGYAINLIFSALAAFIAVGHMTGMGDVPVSQIATSSGPLFVWVVIALGVTAIFSLVLSARGLWSLQRGQSR